MTKKKKTQRRDLIEKYYKVFPIHKRQDLLEETIKLINSNFIMNHADLFFTKLIYFILIVFFVLDRSLAEVPLGKAVNPWL